MWVLFALFLSLAFSASLKPEANESWDFLELVSQWPGATCTTRKCIAPIRDISWWTLHGLWPQRNDGTWPQFCHGPKFNVSQVQDLLPSMDKFWPTYFDGSAQSFWEHEFDKHGTCALDGHIAITNEHDYFQFALKQLQAFPLRDILAKANILPSNTTTYGHHDVLNAIQRATGAAAAVSCSRSGLLESITICFGKSLQLIDCQNTDHCSATSLKYPTWP